MRLLRQAIDTGPLQGIPVSAKDLYVVAGFPDLCRDAPPGSGGVVR